MVVEERATASVADVELVGGRVPNRIMLFPYGTVEPRDHREAWILEGKDHAQAVIDATKATLGKIGFMIDYDHQAAHATRPEVGGRAAAAGWAQPDDLTAGDDGIYADVEWTAAARAALRDKEYRYISPNFAFDKATRRVTRLVNAALVNIPAFEMTAVAAQSHGDLPNMDKIIEALGLAADANEDAIVAAITGLKEQNSTLQEQNATASLAPIATALGLAETANAEELATAASDLQTRASADPDPTRYAPIEVLEAANAKLASIAEKDGKAVVDQAIAAGKVPPANRDWALKSYLADPEGFATAMAVQPTVLPSGQAPGEQVDGPSLTEEEKALCASMGWDEATFLAGKTSESADA